MNTADDAIALDQRASAGRSPIGFSPYRVFSRDEWAKLRADTPMTLVPRELEQLSGLIEDLSMVEVEQIYLPLSRLLNLHVAAAQELHAVTNRFLGRRDHRVPYILGIAGSVAVGKSTTARVLKALLARWPDHPRVDLITTDGFLHPNEELDRRGLMHRKGFPESFDTARLLNFLHEVKSGKENVEAPVYSHFHYDILSGQVLVIDRPDILIVEGLNVLQPARMPKDGEAIPFVSDFFNFSIYIDADAKMIEEWYVTRFMRLRQTAFRDPGAYFHRYAHLTPDEARAQALEIWRTINEKEPGREHFADSPARTPHFAQERQPPHRGCRPAPHLRKVGPRWHSGLSWVASCARLLRTAWGAGRALARGKSTEAIMGRKFQNILETVGNTPVVQDQPVGAVGYQPLTSRSRRSTRWARSRIGWRWASSRRPRNPASSSPARR